MDTYKFTSLILLGFLLLFLIIPSHHISIAEAQSSPVIKVNWRVHSNPTNYDNAAFSICESGDYIYIVGNQGSNARVEMRFKSDGSLVNVWTSKYFFRLYDCIITNDKLYIVGIPWSLLVFDLDLNPLTFEYRSVSDIAYSIQFYNNHVYIAGLKVTERYDLLWGIEKWGIEDLTLVKEYTLGLASLNSQLAVNINPVTKQLWAIGDYDENEGSFFEVKILDLDLKLIKVIRKDTIGLKSYAISFDEEGNAYIGGYRFIAKYDKDGNEVATMKVPYFADKITYIKGYLFIAATEKIQNRFRHVLYVYDKNLNLIDRVILSHDVNATAIFNIGRMAFDGKNLYIAGYDNEPGNERWVIYSVSIFAESERFNMIYLIIGIAIATAIVTILIILIRRKLSKLPPIS
jgi:hypothetical protein